MHRIVRERLEDLLPGNLESREFPDVAAHLSACEECRRDLSEMRNCSELVQALRAPEMEPAPGFYTRLMDGIAAQVRPSPWSVFFDPHFGRRLVYATLTALILMASYFISNERQQTVIAGSDPETIMASQPAQPSEDSPLPALESEQQRASDRDRILVTLTTYSQ